MQSGLMTRNKFLFLLLGIIESMVGCTVLRQITIVKNPNAIGIQLGGFDYEFQVEKMPFFSGDQSNTISIPAIGNVLVQIPISFTFEELQKAFSSLAGKDSTDYTLKNGIDI